jgi:myo-inositol-1(or 4)-monophosphatase
VTEQAPQAPRPRSGGVERPAAAPDPAELLRLAAAAAAAAGRLLAGQHEAPRVVSTKSSPTDVVTEMDRAAERLIREWILAERPGDAFLGEEGGQTGGGALVRWIVDPLDGTVNYLYGLPDWAVSIACEVAGSVVAGVVEVPARRRRFTAVTGGGAWWSGDDGQARPLRCNPAVPLDRALIATGFGYERNRRQVQGQVVAALLPRVRDIRRNGAAAVDLCLVAGGQVDGYYERGVQAWDIAAGTLIATEAGATVGGLAGRPPGPDMTVAAPPGLFAELHDLLVDLAAGRDD